MKLQALITTLALASSTLYAQTVEVKDAWIRASVQGQMATGAFMKLKSKDGAQLVSVSSPVAGIAEVHEMKLEGDVMKMRAVPALDLPAGKTVELKPGGYHVMLQELKAPLAPNTSIQLTLTFRTNVLWAASNHKYQKNYSYAYRAMNYLIGVTYEY